MRSNVHVLGWVKNNGTATVKGTGDSCFIGGDQTAEGSGWAYDLVKNATHTFLNWTFVCEHTINGTLTVTFSANYGVTGSAIFGDNKSVSTALTLTRIKAPPSAPRSLSFSKLTSTSMTLSWLAPMDDGGAAVSSYIVTRADHGPNGNGPDGPGKQYTSGGSTLSRNFTDLVPGTEYVYTIQAVNSSQHNSGIGVASDSFTVVANTGVFVRSGGHWVRAQPFVRTGGVWTPVATFARTDKHWLPTNN
jgi:hypothetical protein